MTMVISVITHDGIVQASDRRLVWIERNGATRLGDDNRNKAVAFGNRIIFAYTGLADIGPRRQPTDEWLAETLHDNLSAGDQGDLLEAVAVATNMRLNHGRIRSLPQDQRGHEFVACGWARFPTTQMKTFSPYIAFVTNLRASDGTLLARPADRCTFIWGALEPEKPGEVWVSGQQLEETQEATMLSEIAQAAPNMADIGAILISHIRIAASKNPAIGRGVLLNALPRGAIREGDDGFFILMNGPMQDTATCFYVPAESDELCQYGPIVVSPSGGVFSGLIAGPAGAHPDLPPG
jgi:hypothetical protein